MGNANEVRFWPASRNESDAPDFIQRHPRPTIRPVFFRMIPRVVTKFARVGNCMERPQLFAADHIKAPDILFESRHDDDLFEDRRSGRSRAKTALDATWQNRVAVLT